jgi:hypothetical protein
VQLEQLCGELAPDVDILCAYPVPHERRSGPHAHLRGAHCGFCQLGLEREVRVTEDEPARQAEAALRHSEQRLAREVARAKTLQSISAP